MPEYYFNLRLAGEIDRSLVDAGFATTVLLVTEGAARPSLFKRSATANGLSASLFLSIHHDSVPDRLLEEWDFEGKLSGFNDTVSGYSLFVSYENPNFSGSVLFARLLGNELKARGMQYAHHYTEAFMGQDQHELLDSDVGIYRYDALVVLKETKMAAVLFEAGSIINRDEELQMSAPERVRLISASVTAAVEKFCDTKLREQNQ